MNTDTHDHIHYTEKCLLRGLLLSAKFIDMNTTLQALLFAASALYTLLPHSLHGQS